MQLRPLREYSDAVTKARFASQQQQQRPLAAGSASAIASGSTAPTTPVPALTAQGASTQLPTFHPDLITDTLRGLKAWTLFAQLLGRRLVMESSRKCTVVSGSAGGGVGIGGGAGSGVGGGSAGRPPAGPAQQSVSLGNYMLEVSEHGVWKKSHQYTKETNMVILVCCVSIPLLPPLSACKRT